MKSPWDFYGICVKQDNIPIDCVKVSEENDHNFGYRLKKEHGIKVRSGIVIRQYHK